MARGINPARSGVRTLDALFAVNMLRLAGATVGSACRVSVRAKFYKVRSIRLGVRVEILRNSTIEGSPEKGAAVTIGDQVRIKENVWLAAYGGQIVIENCVLIGRNVIIHGHGGVQIGESAMLSPGCMVFSSSYVSWTSGTYQSQGFVKRPTKVGQNVWLGAGCVVLGGSVIGDNTIVGAMSVVRGDLEPHSLYLGRPATRIGDLSTVLRATPETIEHWHLGD